MTLAELQRSFQGALLHPDDPLPSCVPNDPSTPARFEIYRHGYHRRLVEALGSHYPMLQRHLVDAFPALCARFIDAHPSKDTSLEDYGEPLSAFISVDMAVPDAALVAELAEFEWTLHSAFRSAEASPATIDAIAAVAPETWPTLTFKGIPSLRRFACRAGGVARWQTLKASSHGAPTLTDVGCPGTHGTHWVVWRGHGAVRFMAIEPNECRALDRTLASRPFAEVCATLDAGDTDQAALQAATWLKRWLSAGWLETL
jgi:hypothetical protein